MIQDIYCMILSHSVEEDDFDNLKLLNYKKETLDVKLLGIPIQSVNETSYRSTNTDQFYMAKTCFLLLQNG